MGLFGASSVGMAASDSSRWYESEFCEITLEYLKTTKKSQKNKILKNAKDSASKLYNLDNFIKLIKPIYDGI